MILYQGEPDRLTFGVRFLKSCFQIGNQCRNFPTKISTKEIIFLHERFWVNDKNQSSQTINTAGGLPQRTMFMNGWLEALWIYCLFPIVLREMEGENFDSEGLISNL